MKASTKRHGLGTGVVFVMAMVFVVLLAGIAYYASTGFASPSSHQTMPQDTITTASTKSPASTTTSSASVQPELVQVSMPYGVGRNQSYNFQPSTINLVIGINNTVMWTNKDSAPHVINAMSVPSGATKFDSGNMMPGTTFTHTFTVPGTYTYACTYHYWMQGAIKVSQAA